MRNRADLAFPGEDGEAEFVDHIVIRGLQKVPGLLEPSMARGLAWGRGGSMVTPEVMGRGHLGDCLESSSGLRRTPVFTGSAPYLGSVTTDVADARASISTSTRLGH